MKTAVIEFEEYPGDEYEVVISPIPLKAFEALGSLFNDASRAFVNTGNGKGIRQVAADLVALASPKLNGEALTAEALGDGDPNLVLALVRQWHHEVRSVPLPLPRRSSGSETTDR